MTVKLLTERHLEFLSLKGDYTGSYESTLVKMPHCWKSHVTAQFISTFRINLVNERKDMSFPAVSKKKKCSLVKMLILGSIEKDSVRNESCYKGTIFTKELHSLTWKMTISYIYVIIPL